MQGVESRIACASPNAMPYTLHSIKCRPVQDQSKQGPRPESVVRLTVIALPDFVHFSQPVCESTARPAEQVILRSEQICKRCFHKVPLLPPRVWDRQSVMLKVLIAVEDDIQIQWPGSKASSSKIPARCCLQFSNNMLTNMTNICVGDCRK